MSADVSSAPIHTGGMMGNQPQAPAAAADPYKAKNTDTEVTLKHKMEDLLHFMDKCKYGMMTTRDANTGLLASRCMELAAKESNGTDLLFYTNTQTHKVDDLTRDPHVNISFVNSAGDWASIAGTATVVTDRGLVKRHYNHTLKAWIGDLGDGTHDGSENDPRLGMIRVRVQTASYSLSDKGFLGRAAEVVHGAVTGSVAHVTRLREVSTAEVNQWRGAGSTA